MKKISVLNSELQVKYTLPDYWDWIIEEMNEICEKIQVVIELQKDYKLK